MKVKLNRPWTPVTMMQLSRLERAGKRMGRWPSKNSEQQLCEFYGVSKDVLWPKEDFARINRKGDAPGRSKRLQK